MAPVGLPLTPAFNDTLLSLPLLLYSFRPN